jgi:hypothetical protein
MLDKDLSYTKITISRIVRYTLRNESVDAADGFSFLNTTEPVDQDNNSKM